MFGQAHLQGGLSFGGHHTEPRLLCEMVYRGLWAHENFRRHFTLSSSKISLRANSICPQHTHVVRVRDVHAASLQQCWVCQTGSGEDEAEQEGVAPVT